MRDSGRDFRKPDRRCFLSRRWRRCSRLHLGREATITLPSIGCALQLADVFDRIVFPELELGPILTPFPNPQAMKLSAGIGCHIVERVD